MFLTLFEICKDCKTRYGVTYVWRVKRAAEMCNCAKNMLQIKC